MIVARAFPPPGRELGRGLPFDPESEHATHVAGIAAGDHERPRAGRARQVSGIAPQAYIGNYGC